ncbi:ABC transporter substrate-binding protein [bacterium AH-315-I20]|nr:ABC transporter substrate-binding protein [bacterium AH-315-I20]
MPTRQNTITPTLFWIFLAFMLNGCTQQEQAIVNGEETLNIGRLICGGHLSLAVVENKYQQDLQNFTLKTIQNHNWDDVVKDMKSGKLAGTFILSPLAMQLIHEGMDAKIVMMADRNGNGFVLSKQYKSIHDLKGKRAIIAVPHLYSQHHVLLYLSLQQHGIAYDDVIVVAMPPRDMIASLSRGEIDGFVVGEPEGNRSISLDKGWMAAISPQIWLNHMDHVFLVSNTFIKEHPTQLQSLINALKKSGDYIEKHPHEAAIMGEDYTGANAQVFEQVLTTPANWIDYSDMIPSDTHMQSMAKIMVDMGLWKDIPNDLHTYTDTSFIQKATALTQQ